MSGTKLCISFDFVEPRSALVLANKLGELISYLAKPQGRTGGAKEAEAGKYIVDRLDIVGLIETSIFAKP